MGGVVVVESGGSPNFPKRASHTDIGIKSVPVAKTSRGRLAVGHAGLLK